MNEPAPVAAEFARAVADGTRQWIMSLCCCHWCSVGELTERLGLTQPTLSHHLAVLRRAGLVQRRRQGRQTFYTLDQERVAVCCGRLVERFARGVREHPGEAKG